MIKVQLPLYQMFNVLDNSLSGAAFHVELCHYNISFLESLIVRGGSVFYLGIFLLAVQVARC